MFGARGAHGRLRETLALLYVVFAAALGLMWLVEAIPPTRDALAGPAWDLKADHLTARAYLRGVNPYSAQGAVASGLAALGPSGNGHPPTTSFWILPLAGLDVRTANTVLAWITILLLLIEIGVTMHVLRYPAPVATAWLALGFVLSCSFMTYHFGVGQLSGVIGFFYFVGWRAARRGEDVLAGLALGAACTMKLFPGVVIILFLMMRRWRAVIAAGAVYLAIAASMTARFGVVSWRQFAARQGPIADLWMGSIQNQSIHGVLSHLFHPVCVGGPSPVLRSATAIALLVSAGLLGLSGWLAWRTAGTNGFDVSYALFVVLSVVTSQWTWEHYAIIYVLPILILGATLARAWREKRRPASAAVLMAWLMAVVVSWRVSIQTKSALQASVQRGHTGDHLKLHLYELLNWTPGIVLLILLLVACRWTDSAALDPPRHTGEPRPVHAA